MASLEDLLKQANNKNTTTSTSTTGGTAGNLNQTTLDKAIDQYTTELPDTPADTTVAVDNINEQQAAAGAIDPTSGQITTPTPTATQTTGTATTAQTPEQINAELAEVFKSQAGVNTSLEDMQNIIGTLSPQAIAQAAQMDPTQLAQLGLSPAQIATAQKVIAPDKRTVQEGEMIDGSAVNQGLVNEALNSFQGQTADPTKNATVQGQLDKLMSDFDGGKTPPWAAGAIRNANAQLAARGLGASSMAGQAVLQATMEAAVPIAAADAQTYATFEMQNLNNRQQATMLAAQERAKFLGMEFDQNFQTKVLNAATITSIANTNYAAEVQIALENAKMAQTVDLANLDAKNAKILADAAAMTNLDLANLDNRQKAALQNSQAFLQMDMSNLEYAQQSELFKAKARIDAITNDTAAENAASQFNASSKNQANQFFADLQSKTNQFNTTQKNAMEQFNAGEANALAQFTATMEEQRNQFNAQNRLIIDQSNAEWRRQVTTTNNANTNEANRINAQLASGLSLAEYNNEVQARRDAMNYAFTSSENAQTRASQLAIAEMSASQAAKMAKSQSSAGMWGAVGAVAAAWLK